jgi:hypothetical protein
VIVAEKVGIDTLNGFGGTVVWVGGIGLGLVSATGGVKLVKLELGSLSSVCALGRMYPSNEGFGV